MWKSTPCAAVVLIAAVVAAPARAAEGARASEMLEREIQALRDRVAALEARQTFTSFMPRIAERFHVMHRAGEAGDWAVAAHELAELERLTSLSNSIDQEKGTLMQSMMAPTFEALDTAVEHGDHEKFADALERTIHTCNACHTATGSAFIEVTLDATDALSLRHPHRFSKRPVPKGHVHGMPTASGPATRHHDEADAADHHGAGEAPHHGAGGAPHHGAGRPAH
jgi:hypothetical protein